MFTTKFIGFLPRLHVKSSRSASTRINFHSNSMAFANVNKTLLWCNNKRVKKDDKIGRILVRRHALPLLPPPSEPPSSFTEDESSKIPYNIIKWIGGAALTVIIPFFSPRLASRVKLRITSGKEKVVKFKILIDLADKTDLAVAVRFPEQGWYMKAKEIFTPKKAKRARSRTNSSTRRPRNTKMRKPSRRSSPIPKEEENTDDAC